MACDGVDLWLRLSKQWGKSMLVFAGGRFTLLKLDQQDLMGGGVFLLKAMGNQICFFRLTVLF